MGEGSCEELMLSQSSKLVTFPVIQEFCQKVSMHCSLWKDWQTNDLDMLITVLLKTEMKLCTVNSANWTVECKLMQAFYV